MGVDTQVLLTILGMAVVTYGTRLGGQMLLSRVSSPLLLACLRYTPGAIIVSLVAPAVLNKGLPEALAGLTTLLVALGTRSLPLAMVVGVASAWGLRLLLGT